MFAFPKRGLTATVGLALLALAAWLALPAGDFTLPALAQSKDNPAMNPLVNAPDFPAGFAWLNSDQALSYKSNLKGQVVVLDFWCYCCINCMHVIPDLEFLEQKYKDQPVVILGVHSNKYDNESDPANIRAAIQRYGINHPVLVDENHKVWDAYGVSAWPTLVVAGSDGKLIGGVSGEGHRDLLDKTIAQALAEGRARGTLAKAPLKLAREGQVRAATGLSFPGKVLADVAGKRLFIIDSNHNRIVITSYPDDAAHAAVQQIVGSGLAGHADGGLAQASFNRPQGGALAGNVLWVADTENHLIRKVDLEKKTVTSVLGTGTQVFDPVAGKAGRLQGLNSPWDVAVSGNRLYIAQAGQHQIFAMNILTGMTEVAAGNTRENIRDGAAADANLAQPSGLALDAAHQILYFADSEVSAIRGLDLKAGKVFTVVGRGLFTFGDRDGDAGQALLQHALGVALTAEGKLLVADTYNHKIKLLDSEARTAKTLAGTGKPGTGTAGGALELFEPAAVAVAGATEAFIADTNNHRVVRWNPQTGAWKELVIEGLAAPGAGTEVPDIAARDAGAKTLASGKPIALAITLALPARQHLTDGAPLSLRVTDGARTLHTATLSAPAGQGGAPKLAAMVPAGALDGRPGALYFTVYYTQCGEGLSAVCTPESISWKITPTFDSAGAAAITLEP